MLKIPNLATLFLMALVLLQGGAAAQTSPDNGPYIFPTGFSLAQGELGRGRVLYGATSPDANWHFTQWGGAGDLPPFSFSNGKWSTANAWSGVQVIPRNGDFIEILHQDGANIQCDTAKGHPSEFDMYIEPNGARDNLPNAINPLYGDNKNFPNLAALSTLSARGTFTINQAGPSPRATPCKVNHANATYGLILRDDAVSPPQMMWYTVQLTHVCVKNPQADPDMAYMSCTRGTEHPQAQWFWTGASEPGRHVSKDGMGNISSLNFAVSDVMSSFGYSMITDNNPNQLSFDFLGRMTQLIGSGKFGIDPDLTHWRLASGEHGQSLWGGTVLTTTWDGFITTWTLKGQ